MVVVDQDRVGRLERGLAHEPAADVLQRLGGDAVDTLGHGGKAEIGAVGDQGGEQRAIRSPFAARSRRAAGRRG